MKLFKLICIIFLLIFSKEKTNAQVFVSDSLVLVEIYNTMNGPNWVYMSNWLIGNVNSWTGITVTNNRVSKINFGGIKLIGNFPNSIGRLSALKEFYIINSDSVGPNSNYIGQLPDSIGNLVNLEILWITFCNLTGSIPTTIGNLNNLKQLRIYNNNLSDSIPSSIGNLTNLEWLVLQVNNLSGNIPLQIGNLINLHYLSLGWNNLIGTIPSTLGNLTKLQTLHLDKNQLSGMLPSELGNIDSLSYLEIGLNNIIKSFPPELCNCTKLTTIGASNNNMSGAIPPCFSNLPSFTLYIENNLFTGSVPETYVNSNTFHLYASNNELDSLSDFSQYCNQPFLKYIDVRSNKMTFEDFEPQTCLEPIYWPQDSVLSPIDTAIVQGENITLNSVVGGSANTYQWKKNGFVISTNTSGLLSINNMSATDTGIYTCVITNSIVTNLTLYRYPVHLRLDTNGVDISERELNEQVISVFPNPTKKTLHISSSENLPTMVYLLNMQGVTLTQTTLQSNIASLNLKNLSIGIYLIKTVSEKGFSIKKIIKE